MAAVTVDVASLEDVVEIFVDAFAIVLYFILVASDLETLFPWVRSAGAGTDGEGRRR